MSKTGIEIHAVMTAATRMTGRLLKAVHLEGLNTQGLLMNITLDGETRTESLYEAHFVPCEPGEHDLHIAWTSAFPFGEFIRQMSERSLKVRVEAGQVAIVEYVPGDQLGNSFSKVALAGSRPA